MIKWLEGLSLPTCMSEKSYSYFKKQLTLHFLFEALPECTNQTLIKPCCVFLSVVYLLCMYISYVTYPTDPVYL